MLLLFQNTEEGILNTDLMWLLEDHGLGGSPSTHLYQYALKLGFTLACFVSQMLEQCLARNELPRALE